MNIYTEHETPQRKAHNRRASLRIKFDPKRSYHLVAGCHGSPCQPGPDCDDAVQKASVMAEPSTVYEATI